MPCLAAAKGGPFLVPWQIDEMTMVSARFTQLHHFEVMAARSVFTDMPETMPGDINLASIILFERLPPNGPDQDALTMRYSFRSASFSGLAQRCRSIPVRYLRCLKHRAQGDITWP